MEWISAITACIRRSRGKVHLRSVTEDAAHPEWPREASESNSLPSAYIDSCAVRREHAQVLESWLWLCLRRRSILKRWCQRQANCTLTPPASRPLGTTHLVHGASLPSLATQQHRGRRLDARHSKDTRTHDQRGRGPLVSHQPPRWRGQQGEARSARAYKPKQLDLENTKMLNLDLRRWRPFSRRRRVGGPRPSG